MALIATSGYKIFRCFNFSALSAHFSWDTGAILVYFFRPSFTLLTFLLSTYFGFDKGSVFVLHVLPVMFIDVLDIFLAKGVRYTLPYYCPFY